MIRNLLFLSVLLILGCKDSFNQPGEYVPVTLVRQMCGHAVLKIQDPAYYYLGETADGESNVFLGGLECFAIPPEDEVFAVQLNPKDFNTDCAFCMGAISYSGNKHYNVRIHTDPK